MDDLGTNDLEYQEERKVCVQPITRKHIPLKLKSNNKNQTLFNTPLTPILQTHNNNEVKCDGPSVNKIAKLSFTMNDIDERLDEDLRFQKNTKEQQIHKIEKLNWNFKVDLIGSKIIEQNIFCCELCTSPIFIYGRMMPCKHVFCIKCARENSDKCVKTNCHEPVERIEEAMHGHIFICTYGKSLLNSSIVEDQIHFPSKITCGRSYMSVRDLHAHIQHRHLNSTPGSSSVTVTTIEDNNQFNMNNSQPNRANLITVMTASPGHQQQHNKNNVDDNKQYIHHNSFLNDKNLIQMNPQLQSALLPTPSIPPSPLQHQYQQQPQLLMQPLLDTPIHQSKRHFNDFNLKTSSNNNFNIPPNFY